MEKWTEFLPQLKHRDIPTDVSFQNDDDDNKNNNDKKKKKKQKKKPSLRLSVDNDNKRFLRLSSCSTG